MGKNKSYDKELDTLQRLKHENAKLKRDIAALRKQLDRIDYTRFQNLVDLVDKQSKEDKALENAQKKEKLKKKWGCHHCGKGILLIKLFDHPLKGVQYWRKCNLCPHKTKMKPYSSEVEGVKDDSEAGDKS